ncbi:MAG: ABC-F family ATP-binding cassette domain-containing protein [Desulfamplus sp.]|nr:ABC-F family ATP-binding cassette domain-containing protein [Desulfamplus sp.]MBF0413472.1 ABC-F family ATP-binding cassette domain-containing protein [Desulfamplus sp.]
MTLLFSYKSIYKTYGEDAVFEDLTINVKAGERLGLIGGNGSGKSTLLRLMAGEATPDAGDKYLKQFTRLVYLPQEDRLDPDKTIEQTLFETLSCENIDEQEQYQRVKRIIGKCGFEDEHLKCSQLSGGWHKRVAIARALCLEPDIMLLDEPTNHLDIRGILWLEEILKNAPFAFVVVSHDRCFLENVCQRVMELGKCYPEGSLGLNGGYIKFAEYRENFLEAQFKQEEILSNKMRRETEWLHQGAKARTTKAKYRIDQAEKMRLELAMLRNRNRQTGTVDINFDSTERKTKQLLTCKDVEKSINQRKLFQGITLKLMPGTRLGLMGENGSGKTTFMSLLENKMLPDSGIINRAENLKIAVFDQNRSQLDPEMTLKEALSPAGESVIYKNRSLHVVSWAKKFLFTPSQLTLPIRRLSGGEKARILIANLMLQPADLLLLDEPTNDLDIPSLEVLEESLLEFPGAVVLVSHDRFLMDRVCNNILYFDGKGGSGIFADYRQCLNQEKIQTKDDKIKEKQFLSSSTGKGDNLTRKGTDKKTGEDKEQTKGQKNPQKFSYKHQFELNQIEEKILKAESELEDIQAETLNPKIIKEPETLAQTCILLQKAQEEVDSLYARWEELESLKMSS